jgi:hypothetical protein
VVIGAIGKLPYAGMTLYDAHYVVGLQELGYEVHYLERQNQPNECYHPETGVMSDDPRYAVEYLRTVLPRFGVGEENFSFIDRDGRCHGSGWASLRGVLDRADFVLTLANPTWFDELERCPRRAYVDGDPMFTQVAMETGQGNRGSAPRHYGVLFTYCARMGMSDCTVPSAGCTWIPTRPVVATGLWAATNPPDDAPLTGLMHWSAGSPVMWDGRCYGHKDVELERFLELPRILSRSAVLALGGRRAPRQRILDRGWQLIDPLQVTSTLDAYRAFVAGSFADLGFAKHAYVASRSGWFSDRSACFLASSRPVLHQDTGFGDWLPVEGGVLSFSTPEDLSEAVRRLEADYPQHARMARRAAEEHFEAATVIGRMLDEAHFR